MNIMHSLSLLQLLDSWRCFSLKLVLPGGHLGLSAGHLALEGALTVHLLIVGFLQLLVLRLKSLVLGLYVKLCLLDG